MTSKKNYTKNSNPSGPTAKAEQTITNRGTCSQTPYTTCRASAADNAAPQAPPASKSESSAP